MLDTRGSADHNTSTASMRPAGGDTVAVAKRGGEGRVLPPCGLQRARAHTASSPR